MKKKRKKQRPVPKTYVIYRIQAAISAIDNEIQDYQQPQNPDGAKLLEDLQKIRACFLEALEDFEKTGSDAYYYDFKGMDRYCGDSWWLSSHPLSAIFSGATQAYYRHFDYLRSVADKND